MIITDDYVKIKDGKVCQLLFSQCLMNRGFESIDGKMYLLFPVEIKDDVLAWRERYLSGDNIVINIHDMFRGIEIWNSNLHAFMDEKRHGKSSLSPRS